jgi:hypothetical protein
MYLLLRAESIPRRCDSSMAAVRDGDVAYGEEEAVRSVDDNREPLAEDITIRW